MLNKHKHHSNFGSHGKDFYLISRQMNIAMNLGFINGQNGLGNMHKLPQYVFNAPHYNDVIMNALASQITSITIVYATVYSDADQSKHQSSASLVFLWGIHRDRWIPHTKGQLRGKCFHLMTSSCLDDIIMSSNVVACSTKKLHYFFSFKRVFVPGLGYLANLLGIFP